MTDINERFHKLRIEGRKIFLDDFELKGVGKYCLTNRSDGKCRRTELELKLLFPFNGDVSIRADGRKKTEQGGGAAQATQEELEELEELEETEPPEEAKKPDEQTEKERDKEMNRNLMQSIRALEWMKAYDAVLPPEVKLEFKRAQNAKAYAAAVEGDLHRASLRNKYLEERMKYFKRMARGQLLLSGALVITMIIILLCRV